MGTTQPLKTANEIQKLKDYFKKRGVTRDYVLVLLGLNTALRISDILNLRWKDIYDFKNKNFYSHLQVYEQKTGKLNQVYINLAVLEALNELLLEQDELYPDKVLFKSRKGKNTPLSRYQAYNIIKTAGQELGFGKNFSCHSLRKTFGYHAWKQGASPIIIMSIFNHSSFDITKRYLSIEQDDKDMLYSHIKL